MIIRPFAGEFAAILPLVNLLNNAQLTIAELEAAHARFPADGIRERLVALDSAGRVVGYANVNLKPAWPPGDFWFTLVVAPEARRQGVGTALLERMASFARAHGGTALRIGLSDDNEPGCGFAFSRGFVAPGGRTLESRLDVPGFDESPFVGVVEGLLAQGVRFLHYPSVTGDSVQQQVYELYKVTDMDTPGYAGTDPALYPRFEKWNLEIFANDDTLLDGMIIAVEGERFVGCTIVQKHGDERGLYTEYTGVLKECRGRKIGLALKLLSVRWAKQYGAPYMTTRNAETNRSMLAINEKMGFVKTSGRYWLTRAL